MQLFSGKSVFFEKNVWTFWAVVLIWTPRVDHKFNFKNFLIACARCSTMYMARAKEPLSFCLIYPRCVDPLSVNSGCEFVAVSGMCVRA